MKAWGQILIVLVLGLAGCGPHKVYAYHNGSWVYGGEHVAVPAGETLYPLNDSFARSATVAWYRADPIDGADGASFQAMDRHYAKDKAHAWYAATDWVGQSYFTTERVRITRLDGADPAKLRLLADGYAVDAAHAYYQGVVFPVADAASFEPLEYNFARDRQQGYYCRLAIAGSDGQTFQVLNDDYARDRRSVWFTISGPDAAPDPRRPNVLRIAGADAASFQALTSSYGKDVGHAYYAGQVLPADPGSFQAFDFGYAKTATKVFYNGEVVPGADAASFTILSPVTDEAEARDRHGLFKDGQRVSPSPPANNAAAANT